MLERMCRLILLLFLTVICAPQVVAEIYRWTDDAGNVIFSDTPRPGAEVVELSEPTIVPAVTPPADPGKAQPRALARPYETLTIARPANDTTLRNTRTVNVGIELSPRLQTQFGHRLQLLFDGESVAPPGARTMFTLSDVDRGAHTLQAEIVTADGTVLERSPVSQFFVHQPSVAGQAR
tara:strand:- start:905 stop:1441 length:537 start_codon:yes stop_codon:yes gene_type:complete